MVFTRQVILKKADNMISGLKYSYRIQTKAPAIACSAVFQLPVT